MQNARHDKRDFFRDYDYVTIRENILTLSFVATTWVLFAVLITGDFG
jgi:hypothetical protein